MFALGNLRKESPWRWAAVIAIRTVVLGSVIVFIHVWLVILPMCRQARRTKALAEMSEIRKAVGIYRTMTNQPFEHLDDLRKPQPGNDGEPIIDITDDPWGHPYVIRREATGRWTVTCLGADGAPGGVGDDADFGPNDTTGADAGTWATPPK